MCVSQVRASCLYSHGRITVPVVTESQYTRGIAASNPLCTVLRCDGKFEAFTRRNSNKYLDQKLPELATQPFMDMEMTPTSNKIGEPAQVIDEVAKGVLLQISVDMDLTPPPPTINEIDASIEIQRLRSHGSSPKNYSFRKYAGSCLLFGRVMDPPSGSTEPAPQPKKRKASGGEENGLGEPEE